MQPEIEQCLSWLEQDRIVHAEDAAFSMLRETISCTLRQQVSADLMAIIPRLQNILFHRDHRIGVCAMGVLSDLCLSLDAYLQSSPTLVDNFHQTIQVIISSELSDAKHVSISLKASAIRYLCECMRFPALSGHFIDRTAFSKDRLWNLLSDESVMISSAAVHLLVTVCLHQPQLFYNNPWRCNEKGICREMQTSLLFALCDAAYDLLQTPQGFEYCQRNQTVTNIDSLLAHPDKQIVSRAVEIISSLTAHGQQGLELLWPHIQDDVQYSNEFWRMFEGLLNQKGNQYIIRAATLHGEIDYETLSQFCFFDVPQKVTAHLLHVLESKMDESTLDWCQSHSKPPNRNDGLYYHILLALESCKAGLQLDTVSVCLGVINMILIRRSCFSLRTIRSASRLLAKIARDKVDPEEWKGHCDSLFVSARTVQDPIVFGVLIDVLGLVWKHYNLVGKILLERFASCSTEMQSVCITKIGLLLRSDSEVDKEIMAQGIQVLFSNMMHQDSIIQQSCLEAIMNCLSASFWSLNGEYVEHLLSQCTLLFMSGEALVRRLLFELFSRILAIAHFYPCVNNFMASEQFRLFLQKRTDDSDWEVKKLSCSLSFQLAVLDTSSSSSPFQTISNEDKELIDVKEQLDKLFQISSIERDGKTIDLFSWLDAGSLMIRIAQQDSDLPARRHALKLLSDLKAFSDQWQHKSNYCRFFAFIIRSLDTEAQLRDMESHHSPPLDLLRQFEIRPDEMVHIDCE